MPLDLQIEYQKHKHKMIEEHGWCPDTYCDWLEKQYEESQNKIETLKRKLSKYQSAFSNAIYEKNIYRRAFESFKDALDTLQSIKED